MSRFMKRIHQFFFLLVLVGFSACSPYLKQFQTAQEAFNKGAETENSQKLNPNTPITVSPESNYRMARTFIIKSMGGGEAKHDKTNLAKDGLLLNAYTIKGLSEWKLGMFSEAISTSKNCKITFSNDESVKSQRDFVVMMSLEALVYNDSVEKYIRSIPKEGTIQSISDKSKTAMENLKTAFEIISEQRTNISHEHPVQTYLIISQLSIAKNLKNLTGKLQRQLRKGRSADYNTVYKPMLEKEKAEINKKLIPVFADFETALGDKNHALYQLWKKTHADVGN
ncbi:MAG: hypothetical protein ACI85I_001435 [Arenicella sp.]|jgi:hypothetical protein